MDRWWIPGRERVVMRVDRFPADCSSYREYNQHLPKRASNVAGVWLSETLDEYAWAGGDRVALAIDSINQLQAAYGDQNADLAYATNPGGVWDCCYIDSSGQQGGSPAMVACAVARVSIVYEDMTHGILKPDHRS